MNKILLLLLCASTYSATSMNSSKMSSNNPPLTSSQLHDQELFTLLKIINEQRAQQMPRQLRMHAPNQISPSHSDENLKEDRSKIVICGIQFCNLWSLFNNRIH